MWENYNKYRVLKLFFDNPVPEGIGFQLREISRNINLAPKSVVIYLKELEREGFVKKVAHRIHGYPVYYANRESESFRFIKKLDMVYSIKSSGLLDYLRENVSPECMVLFGSASKGEDIKGSDIDLFVQCEERKVDVGKFEKILGRKISLFFSEKFGNLSDELKNNIINGVLLDGYLKVF